MFGFLVYPDLEELDLIGPWEIATLWHDRAGGPPCTTIGLTEDPIHCRRGLQIIPETTTDQVEDLEYLLVPGGRGSRIAAQDPRVVEFVRAHAPAARLVMSVCTGVRVLREAGLLEGRRVTTHRSAHAEVREWPEVTLVEERHVHDGPVWTGAGISAGIDLALALVAEESGEEAAAAVQRHAEYFPASRRYGAEAWKDAPAYAREDVGTGKP